MVFLKSPSSALRPIGVFDSGIGGLSVLQALRAELPEEYFVYVADNGNCPYGERGEDFVVQRAQAITHYLRKEHAIKALVVACNTATAAAIHEIREHHPSLPCVGVEPALKPAAQSSKTHRIGVIGTQGTLGSRKFAGLQAKLASEATFVTQPCDGLAQAIELSAFDPQHMATVRQLSIKYLAKMGRFGNAPDEMDVLVLGCTHYVFIKELLKTVLSSDVALIDTGSAVAKQARRTLERLHLVCAPTLQPHDVEYRGEKQQPKVKLLATGDLKILQSAALRWLRIPPETCETVAIF